ncbi:MAG: tetratricopeptide repeat protein [Promethearchaeota archaeon]
MDTIKTEVNLNLKEFFKRKKLTFLVGAGCSVDPPSCLPAGRAMMEAIIRYTCAESEVKNILQLEGLRFEALVEIIRDTLDKNLKLIDYYGMCNKPNIQHFFLAEMIKKGHFVMTTNFDFLIEYALLQSNISKDKILTIITKRDFEKFNVPNELLKQGKKTLYKIHGSTKNVITGENTKKSLITTIQAFGSNKEGLNVFRVEPFKQSLFENISDGRTLIVMGYSGSDDFDIVPTLKILKNLQNIIWISHFKNDEDITRIHEISALIDQIPNELDKVDQILVEIKRMNDKVHIYRVEVNTSRLIKDFLEVLPKISSENFTVPPLDWLKNNITSPDDLLKFYISGEIYSDFDVYLDDALRCAEEVLHISERTGDQFWKASALNRIGSIYISQRKKEDAFVKLKEANLIAHQIKNLKLGAEILINMGNAYSENIKDRLKFYEQALRIYTRLNDLKGKATCLNIIANCKDSEQALKQNEEALQIVDQLGDLEKKSVILSDIGYNYQQQGMYLEALKCYQISFQIKEKLGNLTGKIHSHETIGHLYRKQGNYPEALKQYKAILQIVERIGDIKKKIITLETIGNIYRDQGRYTKALQQLKDAFQIADQLGDKAEKANCYNGFGLVYFDQKNYPKALEQYRKALQIAEQLGDLVKKIIYLNNIGQIYKFQGNFFEALKQYEIVCQIADHLGDFSEKAKTLETIGNIYKQQRNYPEALKRYEEALICLNKIQDSSSNFSIWQAKRAIWLNNIGEIYQLQENYSKALKQYEKALQILVQIGLDNSSDAETIKKNIESLKKDVNQEQAKVLKELEQLIGRYIPSTDKIDPNTFGFKVEGDIIVGLGLSNCGLTTLPESFSNLQSLEILTLANNKLEKLPENFGILQSLQILNLSNNQLEKLPESFNNLQKLQVLNLKQNKLINLSKSLLQLSNLRNLEVGQNPLTLHAAEIVNQLMGREVKSGDYQIINLLELIIEKTISRVNKIENKTVGVQMEGDNVIGLGLYKCGLTIFPECISEFKSLQILNIGGNQLKTLPESFGNMKLLKELNLEYNNLMTLPESFGNLHLLQVLNLVGNQLTTFPSSCGNLKALQTLNLRNNNLTILPESFGDLHSLQVLNLESNQIMKFPQSFGNLKALQILNLRENSFKALPESIGFLQSLQKLILNRNSLRILPESFCELSSLQFLYLAGNYLTKLPECFGNLQSLQRLELFYNQLTTLPMSFGNLKSLQTLNLSNNKLETLPESFYNLILLKELHLNKNQLSSISESFWKLEALQVLNLENNQLTTLPSSFARLQNLKKILLRGNPWEEKWKKILIYSISAFLEFCRKSATDT